MMSSNRQKRIIHTVALRELGLSKEQYRQVMQGAYGVTSSKQLTNDQAEGFIELLNDMKDGGGEEETLDEQVQRAEEIDWGWGKDKYERLASRGAEWARPRQLRKIEAMWREAARDARDEALWAFLERQTGKTHPARLKAGDVEPVLVALETMKGEGGGGSGSETAGSNGNQGPNDGRSSSGRTEGASGAGEPQVEGDFPVSPLGTGREPAGPRPPKEIADWAQEERVLWHLRHVGELTQLEALQKYGVGRLAARILELRKDGHTIETEHRTVASRFGGEATIGVYVLHEEEE